MKEIKHIQKEVANTQDNDGYTPMHLGSFAGDFAGVQFLLSIGGDPKIKCKKNEKDVLDYASNDMVRKYLVDLKNAAKDGDQKSFQLLVNCGHPVDGKATIYGIAPIHNAVAHTHKFQKQDMLETVLQSEADINVSDSNGWTPLHHACQYGQFESIKTLLSRNVDVNRFSNKGYYPIHIAAMNNHPQVIDLLMENNANVESQSESKCTPMHLAAKKGFAKVILTLFNQRGNIYALDDRSWTPLHYAAFYEHKDVVHMLCRFDGDYDKLRHYRNSKGQLAKDLITNPEIKFAFQTLWRAATEGDLDNVRKLIILKHDINEQTREKKYTPLILVNHTLYKCQATIKGHFLIVKFLLENGADKYIKDGYNKSALDYSREYQNFKIFNLLDDKEKQE